MQRILQPCARGARLCGRFLLTLGVWTLWLGLSLLLAGQFAVATAKRFEMPKFLLREIERRLEISGMTVKFGRASLDTQGRILIENARISIASFGEPVVTARSLYIRLSPWALLEGKFEPRQMQVIGVNLAVPSMLSASGRPEEIIRDLDASVTPRDREIGIDYLQCRMGPVAISAHGAIDVEATPHGNAASLPMAEFLSTNYGKLSREFEAAVERLSALDKPVLTAVLIPSPTRGAILDASLSAQGLRIPLPVGVEASEIRARGRFPLLGGTSVMATLFVSAQEVRLGDRTTILGPQARIRGLLNIEAIRFSLKEVLVQADSAAAEGFYAQAPYARIVSSTAPDVFDAKLALSLFGQAVEASVSADLKSKSGTADFKAGLARELLGPASIKTGRNLGHFVDPLEPIEVSGSAVFDKGWKFKQASGHVSGREVSSDGVTFDEIRGLFTYDGSRFFAPEAYARVGDNFARGSYEQDVPTKSYRFLLRGQLRPKAISVWFPNWWDHTFSSFSFPARAPAASVDVRGRWHSGHSSSEFVSADSIGPVVMGVPFDRARVRLFIRPQFLDGIEVEVNKAEGSALGKFTLLSETTGEAWTSLDVEGNAHMDPGSVLAKLTENGLDILEFEQPPDIAFKAHIGAIGPGGVRPRQIHADVRSDSPFKVHGVSLDSASCTVQVQNEAVSVEGIQGSFAGGNLSGTVNLSGQGDARRLKFSGALRGASLGKAVLALRNVGPARKSGDPSAMDGFAKAKSEVRLNVTCSGDGSLKDPYSYQGEGAAQIQGSELGEVSLLGGLSKLLTVTSLRFTDAQGSFKIEGASIAFPDISMTGANSAIYAHGTYSLNRRTVDFVAKVEPFRESKSMVKLLSVVSAPLSEVLQVRLTGTLDRPSWNFAYGGGLLKNTDDQPVAPGPITPTPLKP